MLKSRNELLPWQAKLPLLIHRLSKRASDV